MVTHLATLLSSPVLKPQLWLFLFFHKNHVLPVSAVNWFLELGKSNRPLN